MSSKTSLIAALYLASALPALAVDRVVTDIPAVASLVQAVLGDAADIVHLVRSGSDPHSMALRPSDASALSRSDLIVWVGPVLTPTLERAIAQHSDSKRILELSEVAGVMRLPFREVADFEDHDDHQEDDHDDHDNHDDHDDHDSHDAHDAHDEHNNHAEHEDHHEDDHDTHEGHDHAGGIDPHLWLDPDNLSVWLDAIADAASDLSPADEDQYRANAAAAKRRIARADDEIGQLLENAPDILLVHDALQYFEVHFGVNVVGAISDSEASRPGPKRLATLKSMLNSASGLCFLTEPGDSGARYLSAMGLTTAGTAEIDLIGHSLPNGPDRHIQVLVEIAQSIAACR